MKIEALIPDALERYEKRRKDHDRFPKYYWWSTANGIFLKNTKDYIVAILLSSTQTLTLDEIDARLITPFVNDVQTPVKRMWKEGLVSQSPDPQYFYYWAKFKPTEKLKDLFLQDFSSEP